MRRFFILVLLIGGIILLSYIGIKDHLPSARPQDWKVIRPPGEVSALVVKDNVVYAGGRDGIYVLDLKKKELIGKLSTEPEINYVKALAVDSHGLLWIGHQKGLASYDGAHFEHYTMKEGLPDNRVNALFLDKQQHLWVGTWQGAACFKDDRWQVWSGASGLADDMVNVITQDSQGGMWFGSYTAPEGGLSYYDGQSWYVYTAANTLPHNNVCCIFEDQKGDIWVGTGFSSRGGLVRFTIKEGQLLLGECWDQKDGLPGEKVRSIFQDSSGTYWFGSEYDGIARWDGNTMIIYTQKGGLSGNEVKVWLEDPEGLLWLGTDNGITIIDPDIVG